MKLAKKKKSSTQCSKGQVVFAMKQSGLAAKLDVVHWPFPVDTEGKDGQGWVSGERLLTRAHHTQASHTKVYKTSPAPAQALP